MFNYRKKKFMIWNPINKYLKKKRRNEEKLLI